MLFSGLPALKVLWWYYWMCVQRNGGGVPSRAGADSHINIPPGGILLCILIRLLSSAFFSPHRAEPPAAVSPWRPLNQISISASLKQGKNPSQLRVSIGSVKIDFTGEPA